MLKVSPIVYQPFILVDKREEPEQSTSMPEQIVTIRTTSTAANGQVPLETPSLISMSDKCHGLDQRQVLMKFIF